MSPPLASPTVSSPRAASRQGGAYLPSSLSGVAARASVPPVRPNGPPRVVQADLASADGARKASLHIVFVAGFIPWLQFEVPRIGRRPAERERDAMVKLEVDEQHLVQFQLANELDLDARHIARARSDGLRPAGDANSLVDRLLRHGGIEGEFFGERWR